MYMHLCTTLEMPKIISCFQLELIIMNLFESMRMQIFCEGVNMLNCFRTPVFKRLAIRIIEAGQK